MSATHPPAHLGDPDVSCGPPPQKKKIQPLALKRNTAGSVTGKQEIRSTVQKTKIKAFSCVRHFNSCCR